MILFVNDMVSGPYAFCQYMRIRKRHSIDNGDLLAEICKMDRQGYGRVGH